MPHLLGLDIGGANLKAATAGGLARSVPFQLWKHPDQLGNALGALIDDWAPERLAVTMTGEFCDCFETKREGVNRILDEVQRAFPQTGIDVWSTKGCFVDVAEARDEFMSVAAANWHALATLAGRSWLAEFRSAILLDTGSTTSDIIPIVDGQPCAVGRTDPERLRSKELIYTGARRTPICALLSEGVAAELFATTHDAYLRLGMIDEDPEWLQTADGRPATAVNAQARLSRMLGGDPVETPKEQTYQLALDVYGRQRKILANAIATVASRLPEPPSAVLLCGSGEFLARAAWIDYAADLDREKAFPMKLLSLAELLGEELSGTACAYAVAKLAEDS